MKTTIITMTLALALSGCGSNAVQEVDNTVVDPKVDDNQSEPKPIVNNDPIEVAEGRKLFLQHCATCHGTDAKGITGPSIVGVTHEDISEAILGEADMTYMQGIVLDEDQRLISTYMSELKKISTPLDGLDKLRADLGRKFFFDTNLSLGKNISCASCHDPLHGFIDARFDTNPIYGALSVGDDGSTLGGRNTPTAAYAKMAPDFFQMEDGTYVGGQFWDGRAKSLKEQAKGPFLDPAEMMMLDGASVVLRVKENRVYQQEMKTLYGEDIFNDNDKAYDAIAQSIAKFEKTTELSPFDSKFDRSKLPYFHVDHYEMSEVEKHGYRLFFDQNQTHCSTCHSVNSATESTMEVFTNFKYENIGIPKNLEALLERDGHTDKTDLGLGGREDINNPKHYGKFKVPTLRNIAVTAPYMSNGVFKELKTVLKYFDYMAGNGYTINPETSQPWKDAEVNSTINHAVLETLKPLNDEKIEALESFLKLLTDKKYEDKL